MKLTPLMQIAAFCQEYGYTSLTDIQNFDSDGWSVTLENGTRDTDYHLTMEEKMLLFSFLNSGRK